MLGTMSSIKDARIINSRIAQFKHILENTSDSAILSRVEELIQNIESINNRVIATNYLESCAFRWVGYTLLHIAVIYRKKEVFFYLLNKGADFTIEDNRGNTALHLAFQEKCFIDDKDVQVLMTHLKNNNSVNVCDKYGFSYFHIACMANDVELVQQYITNGVSINEAIASDSSFYPGYTPLHFSVKYCAFEVAEVLLLHGANTRAKDSKDRTPLHVLLKNNFCCFNSTKKKVLGSCDQPMKEKIKKIMGLLFESYTNTDMLIVDEIGVSNLHVACAIEDLLVAENIMKNITDVNHCVNTDSHTWHGYSSLHFAALYSAEAVKLLMKYGADIEVKNAESATAFDLCLDSLKVEDISVVLSLHSAWKNIILSDGQTRLSDLVFAMRTPEELEVFLRNFDKGQNFNELCVPQDSPLWPGFSLMHLATVLFRNDQDTEGTSAHSMRIILNHNLTILYEQEVHGWTPLHLAYRLNKQNAVKFLLKLHRLSNSFFDLVDEDGLSHMHVACAANDKDFLEKLLMNNSNVDAVYRGESVISSTIRPRQSLLHVAVVRNSCIEIVELLLRYGACVNAKDASDMTPVHWLLDLPSTRTEIGAMLLSSPELKESVVSEVGLSHLHVACHYGHKAAMEKLVAAGSDVNRAVLEAHDELSSLLAYAGYTPLMFAIDNWPGWIDENIVAWLAERGADFFVNMPSGHSLLAEAIKDGHAVCLRHACKDAPSRTRARTEIGLTELHLACCRNDEARSSVDFTMRCEDNVNSRIYKTSPSWPGFAPLHVFATAPANDCGHLDKLDMLLHRGADVTLLNEESETPLHVVFSRLWSEDSDPNLFAYANRMLEAQLDFSVNPESIEGISHFHIACYLCNVTVVEEFLEHGVVDVDQPIAHFSERYVAGYTPLLLAFESPLSTRPQRLRTAKLLLDHGANANAIDSSGNTLFHECACTKFFDVIEMLVRYGADPSIRNLDGKTPLECLTYQDNVKAEDVKALLKFGCRFNAYNTGTEEGYVGLALKSIDYKEMKNLIPALAANFLHLIEADDTKRTVIHNIVSVGDFEIEVDSYAKLIEQLMVTGCDIDDQDKAGRTALHLAAKFRNFKAVSALLLLGADVNITDSNGNTAFACDFASCNRQDENDEETCEHFEMAETFALHVKKLELCGLDVHRSNVNLATEACQKFPLASTPDEKFFKELELAKNAKIGFYSLTMNDFVFGNRAVIDYPTMSPMKRMVVKRFLSKAKALRKEMSETAGILQLQHRKAVARVQLVEDGGNSLVTLMGFKLPDVCSQIILKFLSNTDLKMLILTGDLVAF